MVNSPWSRCPGETRGREQDRGSDIGRSGTNIDVATGVARTDGTSRLPSHWCAGHVLPTTIPNTCFLFFSCQCFRITKPSSRCFSQPGCTRVGRAVKLVMIALVQSTLSFSLLSSAASILACSGVVHLNRLLFSTFMSLPFNPSSFGLNSCTFFADVSSLQFQILWFTTTFGPSHLASIQIVKAFF